MKIAILGFGIEGRSTYTFLTQSKQIAPSDITIFDENDAVETPLGVETCLGKNCYDTLHVYDVIRRSPGITNFLLKEKLSNPENFDALKEKLTSQTQYFFDTYTGITIGVTGTKGKSTIATCSYLTLKEAGLDVELAGNVGKPVLDVINFDTPPTHVVYEMSSFMIESLSTYSLDIGIFNTVYSTHTREHNGFENYITSKAQLLAHSTHKFVGHQAEKELSALGFDALLENSSTYGATGAYTWSNGIFYRGNEKLFDDSDMLLLGEHNRHNVCSILGILDTLGLDASHLSTVLSSFGGLEHRVELVGTYDDIIWVNDAIATTPQATVAALKTFGEEIDTLFYGGIDGEYTHSTVVSLIETYGISNLVLFPDTGHYLSEGVPDGVQIFHTRSMKDGVAFAKKHTKPGKIALLSCGSPSFSCWSGFKEKGTLFKKWVKEND